MGIFDFFKPKKEQTDDFDACLLRVFEILSHNDESVTRKIRECLNNTEKYFNQHDEEFDDRGIEYSCEAEKWIKFIAAVDALESAGYASELDYKAYEDEFKAALEEILAANGMEFSLKNITFKAEQSIPQWMSQFNEYAGQSGITVMFIDIDSNCYVLCAAKIADYAAAAEIASRIGILIACRESN